MREFFLKLTDDIDKDELMDFTELVNRLGVSRQTVYNWIEWYYYSESTKPKDTPTLPLSIRRHDRAQRFWYRDDLEQFMVFRDWVTYGRNGVMNRQSVKRYKPKSFTRTTSKKEI